MEIEELIINKNSSILAAMERLDITSKKILFIQREDGISSITDGDIRRWILKNGDLNAVVSDLANQNPIFIKEEEKNNAKEILNEKKITALPILNKKNEIISIVFRDDKELKKRSQFNAPVVMMAGGKGTRLYPYTKILPKPLIPIGELPISEHIINRFTEFGITDFHLIVNHKKNMIKAYYNEIEKTYSMQFIDEDVPLGTGGGLSLLKEKIDQTFILTNCDILIKHDYKEIFDFHNREKNLITMVSSVKTIKIPYGVIEIDNNGSISKMKEKPEVSFFTNTGMYIVDKKVIDELEVGKNIGFPTIIEDYQKKGEKIGMYPIAESSWLDMGELNELEHMRKKLILTDNQ